MNVALKLMTPEEFLVWCLDQPDRWELVHGMPIRMMTGATLTHDAVVVNLITELRQRLQGKPCHPNTADIASRMEQGNVRRPDVTVDCGPRNGTSLESSTPTVFFEVLSPSTRTIDMLKKTEEYKQVSTLRHIVLIDPDMPSVWLWSRSGPDAPWRDRHLTGVKAEIPLEALNLSLPLSAVYDGVELEP